MVEVVVENGVLAVQEHDIGAVGIGEVLRHGFIGGVAGLQAQL